MELWEGISVLQQPKSMCVNVLSIQSELVEFQTDETQSTTLVRSGDG